MKKILIVIFLAIFVGCMDNAVSPEDYIVEPAPDYTEVHIKLFQAFYLEDIEARADSFLATLQPEQIVTVCTRPWNTINNGYFEMEYTASIVYLTESK